MIKFKTKLMANLRTFQGKIEVILKKIIEDKIEDKFEDKING